MSIPQGSLPYNPEHIEALTRRIETCVSCEQLEELAGEAMQSIAGVNDALADQMAKIAPILALLTAPTADPSKIVTWITDFITSFLTPYTKPYVTLAAQIAALSAQITALVSAIENAKVNMPSCNFPTPTLPTIPPLP